MKRLLVCVLALALLLCGCGQVPATDNGKINIVTTIFAYYDFARAVAGDKAEVVMLIKPSADAHSYEPAPADILNVSECDLFIYTGGENDKWAQSIIDNAGTVNALKMLDKTENHTAHEGHGHGVDEHIWTSPLNACLIVQAICDELCTIDPQNGNYYKENASEYINKLNILDADFEEMIKNSARKTVVFGDRFPFLYFAERYNLDCYSAFGGCADESEPDAKTVAELCDKERKENIPVVFYIEMSSDKMAKAIAEDTGAKTAMLHSCHNVSTKEFKDGETYVSLMYKNLDNLKEALN